MREEYIIKKKGAHTKKSTYVVSRMGGRALFFDTIIIISAHTHTRARTHIYTEHIHT